MPIVKMKLFSRKKKNKHKKPRIKDALAPSPAFIAVPSTPQTFNVSSSSEKLGLHTLRPPSSSPDIPIMQSGHINEDVGRGRGTVESRQKASIGTQSEWPPSKTRATYSDEESDSIPGYATVQRKKTHSFPALATLETQRVDVPFLSSNLPASLSSSEEGSVSGKEAVSKPFLSSPLSPPGPIGSSTPNQNGNTRHDLSPGGGEKEILYSKVRKKLNVRSDMDPDPLLKVSTSQRSRSQEGHGRENAQRKDSKKQKESPMMQFHRKTEGGLRSSPTINRKVQMTVDHKEDRTAEYTDEDYLPSEEDSLSVTLTLSEDDEQNSTGSSIEHHNVTYPQSSKEAKKMTGNFPTDRRPPIGTRSLTPSGTQRAKDNRRDPISQRRSGSAPLMTSLHDDGIPFIQPSFIQQLTPSHSPSPYPQPDTEVYIFSEKMADGAVQYYSASPVHPTLSNQDPLQPPLTPPIVHHPPVPLASSIEPGFYSNPATHQASTYSSPLPKSDHTSYPLPKQKSPHNDHNRTPQSVMGTKITKLGSPIGGSKSFRNSSTSPIGGSKSFQSSSPHDQVPLTKSDEIDAPSLGLLGSSKVSPLQAERNPLILQNQVRLLRAEKAGLSEELALQKQHMKLMESQMMQIKNTVEQLRKANDKLMDSKLRLELEKGKWNRTEDCAHSISTQNASLLKQLEMLRQQATLSKQEHQIEVSQLTEALQEMAVEREAVRAELKTLREKHSHLHCQFEKLTESLPSQVSMEEHQEALESIQCLLDELSHKNEFELQSKESRRKKRQNLDNTTKLTEATMVISRLKAEKAELQKSNRRAQERIAELQYEVEKSRDGEVAAHEQLSAAVLQAERAMAEKKALSKIVKMQRKSAEKAVAVTEQNHLTINALERKLEECEGDALMELDKASSILHRSEKDHWQERKQYKGEIRHLRAVLAKKQELLERLAQEKRSAEARLDMAWKASTSGRPRGALFADPELTSTRFMKSWT